MKTAYKGIFVTKKWTYHMPTWVQLLASTIVGIFGWDTDSDAMTYINAAGTKVYVPRASSDGFSAIKTIKKTIGGVGVAGTDFNFVTAANTTEQPIDLGAIIPAKARVIDMFLYTDVAFSIAGATKTLVADIGTASGGAEFIASGTIYAADAILPIAAGAAHKTAPDSAAVNVWVNAIPGENWSTVLNGITTVYVTYIDVAGV